MMQNNNVKHHAHKSEPIDNIDDQIIDYNKSIFKKKAEEVSTLKNRWSVIYTIITIINNYYRYLELSIYIQSYISHTHNMYK